MYPYIDLKFIKIPTYGIMIALGIIAFYLVVINIFEKKEEQTKPVVDIILLISLISFIILGISAFLVNSLFHSIENSKVDIGGFTWLGGVLVAFPISYILFYKFSNRLKTNITPMQILEYIIPALVLAHGIGRIGCFLSGCCYGGPTESFLGVSYPVDSEAFYYYPNSDYTRSLKLWPTQLFETMFDLTLFAFMICFRKKLKEYALEIYCFSYGIFRFLIEYLRADDRGGTGFFMSPSQLMSIILIIYGVIIIIYKIKVLNKLEYKELEK